MRKLLNMIGPTVAGFVGGIVAMLIFGAVYVNAAPKDLTADVLRVSHIIVDGDIRIESKASNVSDVLQFTSPDGGYMKVSVLPGVQIADGKRIPTRFLVTMGSNIDRPDVVISHEGIAITERLNDSVWLAQLAASQGLQLSYRGGSTQSFPMTSQLKAGDLTMNSANGSDGQFTSLNFSGVTSRQSLTSGIFTSLNPSGVSVSKAPPRGPGQEFSSLSSSGLTCSKQGQKVKCP